MGKKRVSIKQTNSHLIVNIKNEEDKTNKKMKFEKDELLQALHKLMGEVVNDEADYEYSFYMWVDKKYTWIWDYFPEKAVIGLDGKEGVPIALDKFFVIDLFEFKDSSSFFKKINEIIEGYIEREHMREILERLNKGIRACTYEGISLFPSIPYIDSLYKSS